MRFSKTTISLLTFVCGGFMAIPPAQAQTITEIIDATGDGAGNGLNGPVGIAVAATGNVYVPGLNSDNVFKVTPAGIITEIMGAGNGLNGPILMATDAAGNVYLTGEFSDNAFKITPAPCPADFDGDGIVGASDLAQLLGSWGPYEPCPPFDAADFNEDCGVNAADLAQLLGDWGPCE